MIQEAQMRCTIFQRKKKTRTVENIEGRGQSQGQGEPWHPRCRRRPKQPDNLTVLAPIISTVLLAALPQNHVAQIGRVSSPLDPRLRALVLQRTFLLLYAVYYSAHGLMAGNQRSPDRTVRRCRFCRVVLSLVGSPPLSLQLSLIFFLQICRAKMKVIAAYLLAVLGGNANPSAKDLKAILASVGIDAADERIELLLSEVRGKDIAEIVASGREKLASVPSGGGVAVSTNAAGSGDAAAQPAPSPPSEKEESDEEPMFGLFD